MSKAVAFRQPWNLSTRRRFRKGAVIRRKIPNNRSLNRKIRKLENTEVKYWDTFISATEISSDNPILTLLNNVSQNDTASGRDGISIRATSLSFKGRITTEGGNLGPDRVRFIIFWDKQANGSAPTLTGFATGDSLLDTSTITNALYSPYNRSNNKRYRVVYDKLMTFNPNTWFNQNAGPPIAVNEMFMIEKILNKKLKFNKKIQYNTTNGGTIADVQTNSLYIACFSDVTDAANTGPTLTMGFRFNFKEV